MGGEHGCLAGYSRFKWNNGTVTYASQSQTAKYFA